MARNHTILEDLLDTLVRESCQAMFEIINRIAKKIALPEPMVVAIISAEDPKLRKS
ncbi:hypothetical protein PGT21_015404 [Puccinia graminis f. sp. tritici]|uniref:Uncharacterized protein n=1 Tax=Puccinia graminis f. sp. tritici TaxID=56615 RepID=A0A5B0SN13_PUCGR|nr:hypothetical protein PGT21_015404 [Puccinia graminis f. sp. tritici]KAA1138533.1 hypothetical protein PGTUg99_026442 [Puccinia graminis f. sp. tritici]